MKATNKIQRSARWLFAALAFVFTTANAGAQDYFPIEPGAEWRYNYSDTYDRSGEAETTVRLGEEKVEKGGEMYYKMESRTTMGSAEPTVSVTFVRKADDGAIYGINPTVSEDEYLFFPASTEVGNVWTGLSGSSAVVETNASVQTAAGDFTDCVVIESIAGEVKAYSYYQKDKGLVAMKLGDLLVMYLKE
ncbi:MAG TPA: hypothetical protein VJ894_07800 [Cryomorphaceae bacterium]|nr:hypothetical protein [Cryomorphaceae bacterium]